MERLLVTVERSAGGRSSNEGEGLLGSISQRQYIPSQLMDLGGKPGIMAESDHQCMEVLDIAVVQGSLSRLIYQGDAGRNDDEHGEKLLGLLDTVIQIGREPLCVELGGALNVGQRVGGHVQRRSVADKTTLSLAPDLYRSRQNVLLNGQPCVKRHWQGWVESVLLEHLAGMRPEKKESGSAAYGFRERRLAHPMRTAQSNALFHPSSSEQGPPTR